MQVPREFAAAPALIETLEQAMVLLDRAITGRENWYDDTEALLRAWREEPKG